MILKRSIRDFQPLIHGLLRNYEGIFDQPVFVRERQLAYTTRKEPRQLAADLAQLEAFGIIKHVPQRNRPSSIFSGTASRRKNCISIR